MNVLRLHIFQVLCFIAVISSLYFICLAGNLPFVAFIVLAILAEGGIFLFTRRLLPVKPAANEVSAIVIVALLYTIVHFTTQACTEGNIYGGWDAFAMWNYHARFLADHQNWQQLYHTHYSEHPDYPLCLSASIASVWRIFQNTSPVVPFIMGLWITIATPLLLFAFFWKRNVLVAIAILAYFCYSDAYIDNGHTQYADILLGLYLLGAFIALRLFTETRQIGWLAICGCCIASMAWTKNEGIMLALLFVLFNIRHFLSLRRAGYIASGTLLPLIALLIHKYAYAPVNDLIVAQGKSTMSLITNGERIHTVLTYFRKLYWDDFRPIVYTFELYIIWCIVKRRWPNSAVFMVITVFIGYVVVYLASPHDLDWHLGTSAQRLVLHLVPTFLFAIGTHLTPKGEAGEGLGATQLSVLRFGRRTNSRYE